MSQPEPSPPSAPGSAALRPTEQLAEAGWTFLLQREAVIPFHTWQAIARIMEDREELRVRLSAAEDRAHDLEHGLDETQHWLRNAEARLATAEARCEKIAADEKAVAAYGYACQAMLERIRDALAGDVRDIPPHHREAAPQTALALFDPIMLRLAGAEKLR